MARAHSSTRVTLNRPHPNRQAQTQILHHTPNITHLWTILKAHRSTALHAVRTDLQVQTMNLTVVSMVTETAVLKPRIPVGIRGDGHAVHLPTTGNGKLQIIIKNNNTCHRIIKTKTIQLTTTQQHHLAFNLHSLILPQWFPHCVPVNHSATRVHRFKLITQILSHPLSSGRYDLILSKRSSPIPIPTNKRGQFTDTDPVRQLGDMCRQKGFTTVVAAPGLHIPPNAGNCAGSNELVTTSKSRAIQTMLTEILSGWLIASIG